MNGAQFLALIAVAAIETQYNHQNSLLGAKRRQFSEQFIVDCDTADWGCGGGFPQSAMRYVKKLGLVSRASYPYRSGQTGRRTKCLARKFKVTKRFRPLKNVKMLSGNIPAIIQFVRHQGPVAAGLWVCRDFMYYTHGIYSNRRCNASTSLGCHAMAIIGYGTDNERDYWLLRNQWGTNWGLNGYIKMARGVNTCQIETWGVSAPIV
ncbi:unnamed protein product, partial [Mesorhabditis belari]|uniref:Peptidase C1A papain C-terminal domain-containing protein n=1 Tax=Mesorhabditis belari TaxID=2138241 RepID=A0AAF3EGT3_9BILA